MTEHLYTPKDVQKERDRLVKLQNGIDPILGEPFVETVCLDHDHETMHVRAALNRNVNAFEGKVVNAYTRCLKWLTDVPLPVILRRLADYYERDYTSNPYHPSFNKKLQVEFNKLKEAEKDRVLNQFGYESGKNGADRKAIFKKLLSSKKYGYIEVLTAISKTKEKT